MCLCESFIDISLCGRVVWLVESEQQTLKLKIVKLKLFSLIIAAATG